MMDTEVVAEGNVTDMYLNSCKAFSTLPHVTLVSKLRSYGFDGQTML